MITMCINEYITVKEASRRLHTSITTTRNLMKSGEIRYVQVPGGAPKLEARSVEKLVRRSTFGDAA